MKLNYWRTTLVGMAFLSICAFWQLYDNVVPYILKETFLVGDDVAGVIMAMDNVLALFMLPFFGKLSDRCRTRFGKRMPFIVAGTLLAVPVMNVLPYANRVRSLPLFIITLGVLLIAMGTYRSPAVALMPDVTPKPLRSKGNAIINLMGALGGVFTLAATSFLVRANEDGWRDYTALFIAISALMVIAVAVLAIFVRENKLAQENAAQQGEEATVPEKAPGAARGFSALAPDVRRSLYLILFSVSLWFMGYNAVTSAFSKYANVVWGYPIESSSKLMMIATVGAVASYLPVGMLSSRFGRKRMIQCGVCLLAACLAAAGFFTTFHPAAYLLFALIGLAWALINVNSYPMVVEISKSGDVGKYTGYYYTFSMAAQIITPIVSGWLLQNVGYHTLMPYATIMVALSLITISLSKHGDNKPEKPKSRLEAFDVGDD